MRIRRTIPILIGVLLVAGAVALVVVLRKHAPPESARLLPSADGFVYVDLKWMRRANLLGTLPEVLHDPQYEQFVQATGIDAERDLEEAALAIHYPDGPTGTHQGELHFSEVLIGHFQAERLRTFLKQAARFEESYRSTEIYSIPLEDRTLRVAILAVDTVAASNVPDPQVIQGIIDRSRKLASPFGGPAMLRQYYKEVPLASLAWAVVRMDPASGNSGAGPFNWSFLFPRPAVVVASVRYLGSVHLQAAAFTESSMDASRITNQVGTYLDLFRTAQNTTSASGTDPDVKTLFDSLKVEQHSDRAVVSGVASVSFVRKLLSEAPAQVPTQPSEPTTPPAKKGKRGNR